jgi:hypothetical protein
LKCRCLKWARTIHLDIYNTSYGKRKGRESNWQFDSWPQKVGNQPDPCVQVECDTPLESSQWELQHCFRPHPNQRSKQRVIVPQSDRSPNLGSFETLRTKSHSDVGATKRCREYYMGEGGGFPRVRAMVNLVSPKSLMTCPSIKCALEVELTNLLVGLIQIQVSN